MLPTITELKFTYDYLLCNLQYNIIILSIKHFQAKKSPLQQITASSSTHTSRFEMSESKSIKTDQQKDPQLSGTMMRYAISSRWVSPQKI
jgi:hypothetical protein